MTEFFVDDEKNFTLVPSELRPFAVLAEPLTDTDIVGVYAGLRPLLAGADTERTADLSRRHAVARSRSGLVSVFGGKLTTYRQMAEDVATHYETALQAIAARCRA